jgi:hypothetical protein
MDNVEKTVLEFSVELFLNWHGELYLEDGYTNSHTMEIYKEIGQPIISKEYFKTVESMVLNWEFNSQKTEYFIGIINAKSIDSKAVRTVIKQFKYQILKLIDIDLIEFWKDPNPICSYFIANELDPKEDGYIRKLEQSDAQKTTFAAANLINIKVYQWICEYEKEYEAELLNPLVLEPTDEKKENGLTMKDKIELLNELGFFDIDKVLTMKVKDRNKVLSLLIERSQDNIRDAVNDRKRGKIRLSILNEIIGESDNIKKG